MEKRRLGAGAVAVQDPPLGTGHAVLAAKDALWPDFDGDVVVTYADAPLPDAPRPRAAVRPARREASTWPCWASSPPIPLLYGRIIKGKRPAT